MGLSKEQVRAWNELESAARAAQDERYREVLWERFKTAIAAYTPPAPAAPAKGQQRQSSSSTRPVTGHGGRVIRSGAVCPFGRDQGKPIEELDMRSLDFIIARMEESIDDPAKERYLEKNKKLLDAVLKEKGTR